MTVHCYDCLLVLAVNILLCLTYKLNIIICLSVCIEKHSILGFGTTHGFRHPPGALEGSLGDKRGLLHKTGAQREVTQPGSVHSWDLDLELGLSTLPQALALASLCLLRVSRKSPPPFVSLFPACLSISKDASAFISPPVRPSSEH